MKKTGVFYGSSTGTCEELANQIAEKLRVSSTDVHSVDKMTADKIKEYEVLVLGTSTWGDGELQDDWYDGVKVLKSADLSMKFVALFGCGDSESYCDTFCDGIGVLYEDLKDSGCTFLRQFGIKKCPKKLVISLLFCNFIVDNQLITNIYSDDYH